MDPRHLNSFLQHGGFYRGVHDLSVPWVPTPPSSQIEILGTPHDVSPAFSRDKDSECLVLVEKGPEPMSPPRNRRIKIFRRLGFLFRTCTAGASEEEDNNLTEREVEIPPDTVRPHEWKAYAYYSRPRVNDVTVHNSPVIGDPLPNVRLEEVWHLLRSPGGTKHPERWVAGIQHSSLPPRPTRWRLPKPGEPLPFPWECQLNPLLQHHRIGPSPVYWDMGLQPLYSVFFNRGTRHNSTIPISDIDRAQPATWPFVTHLYVNVLAEDPSPRFPWPALVTNSNGIRVGDVLDTLFVNFQQYVKDTEWVSWHSARQEQAFQAYVSRKRGEQGLRRVDYIGQMCMFRGLEPSPDGEGWTLFVGMA